VGTDAALFIGSTPVDRLTFAVATQQVTFDGFDVAVQAVLGVAQSEGRYIASDVIVLEPDGRWHLDDETPDGIARIERASFSALAEDGIDVAFDYLNADVVLTLLLDGQHLPDTVTATGSIRAWLPVADRDREIIVGIVLANGTIRGLERFTLTAGTAPGLHPGAPIAPEASP
jgi:hypothetical protein